MLRPACIIIALGTFLTASGVSPAASILVRPDKDSIQLLIEGPRPGTNFALVFDKSRAGISGRYNLDHDPKMELNLAPNGQGHRFSLFQSQAEIRLGERKLSISPGPAQSMDLVEDHPERTAVSFAGPLINSEGLRPADEFQKLIESMTGRAVPGTDLPRYEIRYTVYPNGAVYVQLLWIIRSVPLDVVSHHAVLATAPTDQFVAVNDWSKDKQPFEWPASFVLHHGIGKRYHGDVLFAPHFSRHETDWLGQYLISPLTGRGWFRSGFSLVRAPQQFREGRYSWEFFLHFQPGTDGRREVALDLTEDYRHPDTLKLMEEGTGTLDINADGDSNFDSFNERDGTYDLLTGPNGVRFTISGKDYPRFFPAFSVGAWKWGLPDSVRMDGVGLRQGRDFNAFVQDNRLFVQYLGVIADRRAYFEFLPRERP